MAERKRAVRLLLLPVYAFAPVHKQITYLTSERKAELFKHVGAEHGCAAIAERKQGWVAYARHFLQVVKGPFLALQQTSQLASDHRLSLPHGMGISQDSAIYQIYFTYSVFCSTLQLAQKGHLQMLGCGKVPKLGPRREASQRHFAKGGARPGDAQWGGQVWNGS